MVLQRLKLENFQGIRSLEIRLPGGRSASIYGDNATGKTTLFNALTWLLFDKASTGAKGFTPQTVGPEGKPLHDIADSAEGEFLLEDGSLVILKKVYQENWKRKRGAAEAELVGHTTDYFLDGVPAKESEYKDAVIRYCGGSEQRLMTLMMPDYFPERMGWEDRRRTLLDVCGDVSDEEVMASDKELIGLRDFLKIPGDSGRLYSIDEYRKIATAQRKEINRKLDAIPERIDEAEKAIPDAGGMDVESIQKEISRLEKEAEALEMEKAASASQGAAAAALMESIAKKKAEIAEAKAAYVEESGRANADLQTEAQEHTKRRMELKSRAYEISGKRMALIGEKEKMERDRKALLEEWGQMEKAVWNPSSETCPACGQRLPEGKIEEKRREFNLRKSNGKEDIRKRGALCSKDKIAEKEAEIKAAEAELEAAEAGADEEAAAIQEIKAKMKPQAPFEVSERYKALSGELSALEAKRGDLEGAEEEAEAAYKEKLFKKRTELSMAREKAAAIAAAAEQRERVEELREEQRGLSEALDQTEKGLHLADLFIRAKVSMLTERINSEFQTVSFQLFADQVNGGVRECCEVLVPGAGGRMVPYAYANNAARINAGLEIIGTLSEHWGIRMPVVIDNCEAVTRPLEIGSQEIRLHVSEPDKALRVEVET